MTDFIKIGHIGDILREEFMEPLGLSMNALARAIGMPANCIHGIVHGTRGISAQVDLRLTRYFGLSQGYFLRIQNHLDMVAAKRAISEEDLLKIIPISIPTSASHAPNIARM